MTERGFTLIELLVSISVLALVAGVGGGLVVSSISAYNKSQILNTLSQNGDFAMSTLKNEIQNSVAATCNSFTNLTLTNKTGALVIYSLNTSSGCPSNGSLVRNLAGVSSQLLNTSGAVATIRVLPSFGGNSSSFVCNGDLVTTTLVLAQACDQSLGAASRVDSSAVTTIKTSVVVRGSYK